MMASHLQFWTHSFWLNLMMAAILNSAILDSAILHTQKNFWLKLIHSDSTWWWQPSWILLILDSAICTKTSLMHSDSSWWWQPSWILLSWIQPFCTNLFKTQTHSFSLNLMMAAILKSAILDSAICTKKTSLIHSHSTWWWQPSWSLPCWIQTLPSWIQTPCYLLSDSLKNTLPPLWLCLKLIPSD